jgi:hypothetical protein
MKNKNYILGLGIIMISTLFSCKSGLLIGEAEVPFTKICGSLAEYECRANGVGPTKLKTYRTFKKERPRVSGKTQGYNYYNLGRSMDIVSFNNPGGIVIELNKNEVEIDTAKVDYDLKKENLSDILAELDASLKKSKIALNVSLDIKNDFKKELDNHLKIEANIITYTITADIQDGIRDAKSGVNTKPRFLNAVNRLQNSGTPLVREVKVVEEICSFSESKNISNLLEAILEAKLGEGNTKATGILNATLSKKKTSEFSSSFELTSIYSYGYWNDNWMN